MSQSSDPKRLNARKVSPRSASAGGYASRVLGGSPGYTIPQNMHLSGYFSSSEMFPGDGTEFPSQQGKGISGYTRTAFADIKARAEGADGRLPWTIQGPEPRFMFHFQDRNDTPLGGWPFGPGPWPGEGAVTIPDRFGRLIQGIPNFTPTLGSYEKIPRLTRTFTGATIEVEIREEGGISDFFMNLSMFYRKPSDGRLEFRTIYIFLERNPDFFYIELNGEADYDFNDYYTPFEVEATYDDETGDILVPAVENESDWVQIALTINPAEDALFCHVNGEMIVKAVGGSNTNTSVRADYPEDMEQFSTGETFYEEDQFHGFMRVTQDALYDGGDYVPRSLLDVPPLTDTQQEALESE